MITPQPPLHVAVLGAGSWGTALAVLASRQHNTLLWARDAAAADAINSTHRNSRYLPDIELPATLRATSDLDDALAHVQSPDAGAGLIILGVPVAGLDDICAQLEQIGRA